MERIQELLRRQDMTLQEISDSIHMSTRWAREYINHLHELKMIHIAEYRLRTLEVKTVSQPIYCWGNARDEPKPPPLTGAQKAARIRNIIKSDQELHEKTLAKRRAAKWTPQRDWTAAWIPTRQGAA